MAKMAVKSFLKSRFPRAVAVYRDARQVWNPSLTRVFSEIYHTNAWQDPESLSGRGSTLARTGVIMSHLPLLLQELNAKTLLDAACGDLNWIRYVELHPVEYIGVDIVPDLISRNRQLYENQQRTFALLDITRDRLPNCDVILCRDCLIHLSFRRIAAAILAGLWLWVGWAYFLERYQTINWAAGYVAVAFCIEALLLLWRGGLYGLSTSLRSHSGPAGLFIFMFALCAYPLVAPLLGRPWTQAEVFGLAPDPTAMATLGILMASSVWRWELLVIPGLWCLASAVTLWAMGSPDAVLPAIAAAAALLSAIARRLPVSRGV